MKAYLSKFSGQLLSRDEMKVVVGGKMQFVCCCAGGSDFSVSAPSRDEAVTAVTNVCGASGYGGCSGGNPS